MYDIIGDVHGHAQLLKKLLTTLGYKKKRNGYTHSSRKAVFVGDFINRGPDIRKTIRIVRDMVENGNAHAVLGNHEINAIIASLKDKKGMPLIKPPLRNFISVLKTTEEFANAKEEWAGHLKWLRSLPLFLEMDGIRVIHACWSDQAIDYLRENITYPRIKKRIFHEIYNDPGSKIAQNIWLVTKGPQFKMPGDLKIINNKGVSPRSYRIRWWEDPHGKTFEELSFESKFKLPQYNVPDQILPVTYPYNTDNPVLFFGHYCRFKGPYIINQNMCCVDSCVNGSKVLTAYSWQGEKRLIPKNLLRITDIID
jgi:hypothetical protein